MSRSRTIIAPATGAVNQSFIVGREDIPARLTANSLTGSEQVVLKALDGATGVVETPLYADGAPDVLEETRPVVTILAPGQYKVEKPSTSLAAGVYLTLASWV